MAGNLVIDSINGVNISVSPPATQAYANSLLFEAAVTGSAVTSIDFPLLDINTHKSYRVEIELYNPTASPNSIYLFVNNNTVQTNYQSQYTYSNASTIVGGRVNNAQVCQVIANGKSIHNISVIKSGGLPMISVVGNINNGGSLGTWQSIVESTTVTNITQLTFIASVALSIGVGSKIRIYRGDV